MDDQRPFGTYQQIYDMYRIWKSVINNEERGNKKVNFKTYDRTVSGGIQNAKHQYSFNTFISHKK